MPVNLHSIKEILQQAFKIIHGVHNEDIVICLGNTGCGKSTLLYSLLFGPNKLKLDVNQKK